MVNNHLKKARRELKPTATLSRQSVNVCDLKMGCGALCWDEERRRDYIYCVLTAFFALLLPPAHCQIGSCPSVSHFISDVIWRDGKVGFTESNGTSCYDKSASVLGKEANEQLPCPSNWTTTCQIDKPYKPPLPELLLASFWVSYYTS